MGPSLMSLLRRARSSVTAALGRPGTRGPMSYPGCAAISYVASRLRGGVGGVLELDRERMGEQSRNSEGRAGWCVEGVTHKVVTRARGLPVRCAAR
eukprot:360692-Chlamydomonas_euryale.AAC.3